jgi:hypothetical protein
MLYHDTSGNLADNPGDLEESNRVKNRVYISPGQQPLLK